jgi:hypothetical protein
VEDGFGSEGRLRHCSVQGAAAHDFWPRGRMREGRPRRVAPSKAWVPHLGLRNGQVPRMRHCQGARGVWTPARRGGCGVATWPALRRGATWLGMGVRKHVSSGPLVSAYDHSTPAGGGTPKRADGAPSQPERADAQECFRVALFDQFKQ